MSTVIDIFAAPGEALRAIRERPTFLLPLVLIMAGACIPTVLYLNGVDVAWYFEQLALQNPRVTETQAVDFGQMMGGISKPVLASLGAASSAIIVLIVMLVQALYFRIVTLIAKDGVSYRQWFSVVCWCSVPLLLAYLATSVTLLTSEISLLPRERINPLTLANLARMQTEEPGAPVRILSAIDLTNLWVLVLLLLAYRLFTGKGLATATAIVLAPALLILGFALVN